MDRLLKLGILLLVMSFLVIYLGSAAFQSSFSPGKVEALGLMPYNSQYVSFTITNTTVVGFVYYTSGTPINYYMLNQSGFASLPANLSGNQTAINASRLQGNGAIEIIYNRSGGIFPYQSGNASSPGLYEYNQSPVFPPGTYYNLFQNPSPSNITVFYSLVTKSQGQIQNSILYNAAYGITGTGMFIGGLVLIVYSMFLRKVDKKPESLDEQAQKIYDSEAVAGKPTRSRHRRKKSR